MKVRAIFAHPISGIHDVIADAKEKSIEEFKVALEDMGCSVLSVEEYND